MAKKMKPIIFSGPMVQAIKQGRKAMTRRVVKARYDKERQRFARMGLFAAICLRNGMWHGLSPEGIPFVNDEIEQPRFQPGDILWVRETWSTTDRCGLYPNWVSTGEHFMYRADAPDTQEAKEARWFPSIHMPRRAARLFLRVKAVRAERLQDISQEDMIREGAWVGCADCFRHGGCFLPNVCNLVRTAFHDLWDGINSKRAGGIYGWDKNPWVWAYTFERISKEEAEKEAA